MKEDLKHTISVLVTNKPGVLVRVATVFARRGFNIDSLAVSPAHKKGLSRMTIVTRGTPEKIEQIVQQVGKLIDTVHVYDYSNEDVIAREMVMIKVRCNKENRNSVMELARIFRAKPVDICSESIVFELTGTTDKIDAFEKMLDELGIVEMMRTGQLILARGASPT